MINIGGNIGELYVGSTKIAEAYVGSELVYENTPAVPVDIAYLESTGTQYIQLPMDVAKGTFFELDMYLIPRYAHTSKYSVLSASPYTQFEAKFYSRNSSTGAITYDSTIGTKSTSGAWGGSVDEEIHYILSTTGKTNNAGTYTALSRPLTADITNFRLFGGYRNSSRYPIAFRKVKITAGTTVLYDLKAVRVGSVGYMYDEVSGELFGNSGTGSFTLGNDVV